MTYTSGYQSPSTGSSIYSPFNRSSAAPTGPSSNYAPSNGNSMGMDMLAVSSPEDIDRLSSNIDDKLARIRNAFSQPQGNGMMAPQFMAATAPTTAVAPPTQADLDWALQLETKVKQQNYQPNAQETQRYEDIAKRLMGGGQPTAPAQQPQPNNVPTIPGGVSQADIDWAMQLEAKVKQQNYQPTPQETQRYEDIAKRLMNGGGAKTTTAPPPSQSQMAPPVTQADIDWAMQLEAKVKQQNYQPNAQETQRYEDIAKRLAGGGQPAAPANNQFMAATSNSRDWSTWSKPFDVPAQPTMPLPIASPNGSPVISVPTSLRAAAPPPQQFQAAAPPQQYQVPPQQQPMMPPAQTGAVSQQDIQWALDLENRHKTQQYQPNPQEMARYQDIANRLSASPTSPAPVQQQPPVQPQVRTQNAPPQFQVPPQAGAQNVVPPQMTPQSRQQDLQWAVDFEHRVNNLRHQPNQQEVTRYQNIINCLDPNENAWTALQKELNRYQTMATRNGQQPQQMTPPQQFQGTVSPQQYQVPPQQQPMMPPAQTGAVSQQDVQWALDLEQRVKLQQYQPTPQDLARYENIANRLNAQQTAQVPMQQPVYQQPTQPMPIVPNQYPMVQGNVPQMLPQPPRQNYPPQQPMMQYPQQPQYQQPGMPMMQPQPQSPGFWSKLKTGFGAFMAEMSR